MPRSHDYTVQLTTSHKVGLSCDFARPKADRHLAAVPLSRISLTGRRNRGSFAFKDNAKRKKQVACLLDILWTAANDITRGENAARLYEISVAVPVSEISLTGLQNEIMIVILYSSSEARIVLQYHF